MASLFQQQEQLRQQQQQQQQQEQLRQQQQQQKPQPEETTAGSIPGNSSVAIKVEVKQENGRDDVAVTDGPAAEGYVTLCSVWSQSSVVRQKEKI